MTYKEQASKYNLKAPPEFWLLTEHELHTYGCGPGKNIGDALVPDTIWGLNIKVACIIHDLDCNAAKTESDWERGDERFLINLLRIINAKSNFFIRGLRRYRALTYYNAVEDIGKKYWSGGRLI